jgi:ubiquitin-protein ligase E3 C
VGSHFNRLLGTTSAAYRDFASSFLTEHEITFFEQNIGKFVGSVDCAQLSEVVLDFVLNPQIVDEELQALWLLAHFIALERSNKSRSALPLYLKALNSLLSPFSGLVRNTFTGSESREETLPSYITRELRSLVTREEISSLLKVFAT